VNVFVGLFDKEYEYIAIIDMYISNNATSVKRINIKLFLKQYLRQKRMMS
jgi:hypothetical protein